MQSSAMVPLSMNSAREEVILALTAPTRKSAEVHQLRAARLLKGAVCCIKANPDANYDWALLGSGQH